MKKWKNLNEKNVTESHKNEASPSSQKSFFKYFFSSLENILNYESPGVPFSRRAPSGCPGSSSMLAVSGWSTGGRRKTEEITVFLTKSLIINCNVHNYLEEKQIALFTMRVMKLIKKIYFVDKIKQWKMQDQILNKQKVYITNSS